METEIIDLDYLRNLEAEVAKLENRIKVCSDFIKLSFGAIELKRIESKIDETSLAELTISEIHKNIKDDISGRKKALIDTRCAIVKNLRQRGFSLKKCAILVGKKDHSTTSWFLKRYEDYIVTGDKQFAKIKKEVDAIFRIMMPI